MTDFCDSPKTLRVRAAGSLAQRTVVGGFCSSKQRFSLSVWLLFPNNIYGTVCFRWSWVLLVFLSVLWRQRTFAACHLDNQPNRAARECLDVARYLSCKWNLLIYLKILFLYTWYETCTQKLFQIFIKRIRVWFCFGKSLQF